MSIDYTKPLIGKARLLALEALIISNMSTLGTSLASDSETNYLSVSPFTAIGSWTNPVQIGDLEALWPISEGPIKIFVSPGGHHDGLDFTQNIIYIEDEYQLTLSTAIFIYLHPDCFKDRRTIEQARKRVLVMETASDWLRSIVGSWHNGILTLTSNEMQQPHDQLVNCKITAGHKGEFGRAFGQAGICHGCMFLHTGIVAV